MTDEQVELKRQVARWEKETATIGNFSAMNLDVAISLANRLVVALDRIEFLEGERDERRREGDRSYD